MQLPINDVVRAWIDQPSTLQAYHHMNGTNVLARDDGNGMAKVYFLSGDVISSRVSLNVLSAGWV